MLDKLTPVVLSAALLVQQGGPAFEVGVLKPTHTTNSGVSGGCRGLDSHFAPDDPSNRVPLGRCIITAARLSHLMVKAFGIPMSRISGFPEWDGPSRFDLEAKAEDPSTTTDAQLSAMLRSFLIEQFKLTLRRETKEGPIFALVPGRNGPKNLKPSALEGPSMTFGGASLVFKGYTMQDLADYLSQMPNIDRPVRDMTNLEGRFDFSLNVLDTQAKTAVDAKLAMSRWESLFSDVQEQLGLRLENSRGSVDTIVIEKAEKPK